MFYLFNSKSMHEYVYAKLLSNRMMLPGIGIVIVLQLLITYHPLMNDIFRIAPISLFEWIWIIPVVSSVFFVIEFEKYLYKRKRDY